MEEDVRVWKRVAALKEGESRAAVRPSLPGNHL